MLEGNQPIGIVALGDLIPHVGRLMPLADAIPALGPLGFGLSSGGVDFQLSGFVGGVLFSQIDVQGRAFLAQFVDAGFVFEASTGARTVCRSADGLLWAVPGNFL